MCNSCRGRGAFGENYMRQLCAVAGARADIGKSARTRFWRRGVARCRNKGRDSKSSMPGFCPRKISKALELVIITASQEPMGRGAAGGDDAGQRRIRTS